MKLGLITKPNKRSKTTSKNCDVMVNLEQSGSRIPDAKSAKLIFSLIVTFHLEKTENRTKNL